MIEVVFVKLKVVLQVKGVMHPIRRSAVLAPAPFTKYVVPVKKKVRCPEVASSDILALLQG